MFRYRNVLQEVDTIDEACRGHVDPEWLIDHAQARANQAGTRLRVGIDWLREALEEGADFVNYLTWDIEDHFLADGRDELLVALAEIASAYERVRRVRETRP